MQAKHFERKITMGDSKYGKKGVAVVTAVIVAVVMVCVSVVCNFVFNKNRKLKSDIS